MESAKKGFIPVMLTPFNNDGTIDFPALTKLTEAYLKAGASGLFANCLSSEMFELTDKERIAIINHVIDVTRGAVPVVASGTFGGAIAKQADFVKKVNDCGVNAVIAITSLLADKQDSDSLLADNVLELLRQTDRIPLGFYECPVPYKRVLSPKLLAKFVATGRVIYHKDTSLKLEEVREKVTLASNPDFGLYDAYMGHAVDSLKAGSAGLSCIQGNYFPELIVWLCENFDDESRSEEVATVQQFLIDNMDVMHHIYPVVSKYFLQKRGLQISTFTRRDVGSFSSKVLQEVENLFVSYNLLKNKLEINYSLA